MWFRVGLVIAMFVCCTASPEASAALVTSLSSAEGGVVAAFEPGPDTPELSRGEFPRPATDDLLAVEPESETEDEVEDDTMSDIDAVVASIDWVRQLSNCRVGPLVRRATADSGHLLVSTGLGRGPPLA